ncbi:DUF1611 domain-containing protein [Crateriforma conspicua]|uniref:DUF1611 domain-containing protein n=1 Tax=Crateriforma conspicua TaxID=2527996 RepID=UPI001187A990|nr:DUF1611 domain-containing protein [Crateriforma conspicua]QDV64860.1 hypothetical protein Mal65_40280 [Crateriforma conspicua]
MDLRKYQRIALLTDGFSTPFLAKTAINLMRYRGDDVVAVIDRDHAGSDAGTVLGIDSPANAGIPVLATIDQHDIDAVFVGIAPPGGKLPPRWDDLIAAAIDRGIDVVSGLHEFLCNRSEWVSAAERSGSRLIDVRKNDFRSVATCAAFDENCLRIHAIGNDCSLGKMVTCLEIQKGLQRRDLDAGFAATGQTGIMIAGTGIPIDCVVADFVNGAAESLTLAHQNHDVLLIEGQGSLSHPMFSAVTLGLLHGCAPDGLVFCYQPGRDFVKGLDGVAIPPLRTLMDLSVAMANLRHPCRLIGIAANTSLLSDAEAESEMQRACEEFGLPVCDVYRNGPDVLVDAVIRLKQEQPS